MKKITKKWTLPIAITAVVILFVSCSNRVVPPPMEYPLVDATVNRYEFGIENLDKTAKCDRNGLSAFYEGFVVTYSFDNTNRMYFEIENKTNKSLIIDKSKCYVLYSGYSYELFKDVRTGKVTTYNDVQDAINSVQTNESSITMSIPPYSKWILPVEETNIKTTSYPKISKNIVGSYPQTVYSSQTNIEFVIPYSFDYRLAKWKTSRNRIYFDNLSVVKIPEKTSVGTINRYYSDKNSLVHVFLQDEDAVEWHKVREWNYRGRFQKRK